MFCVYNAFGVPCSTWCSSAFCTCVHVVVRGDPCGVDCVILDTYAWKC